MLTRAEMVIVIMFAEKLIVMYYVMQHVHHGVRGIVILVVMGWPLVIFYILFKRFFLFHIKYMRKGNELWKSDNARGITRMSDDQRLGSTMII